MSFLEDDLEFIFTDVDGGFAVTGLHVESGTQMMGVLSEQFSSPALGIAVEIDTTKPHFQTLNRFSDLIKRKDKFQANDKNYRINKHFVVFDQLYLELYEADNG